MKTKRRLLRIVVVARNKADDATLGLRVATRHRVKGLEFKVVFIAGANEDTMPVNNENSNDETEHKLAPLQERSLFYFFCFSCERFAFFQLV